MVETHTQKNGVSLGGKEKIVVWGLAGKNITSVEKKTLGDAVWTGEKKSEIPVEEFRESGKVVGENSTGV